MKQLILIVPTESCSWSYFQQYCTWWAVHPGGIKLITNPSKWRLSAMEGNRLGVENSEVKSSNLPSWGLDTGLTTLFRKKEHSSGKMLQWK